MPAPLQTRQSEPGVPRRSGQTRQARPPCDDGSGDHVPEPHPGTLSRASYQGLASLALGKIRAERPVLHCIELPSQLVQPARQDALGIGPKRQAQRRLCFLRDLDKDLCRTNGVALLAAAVLGKDAAQAAGGRGVVLDLDLGGGGRAARPIGAWRRSVARALACATTPPYSLISSHSDDKSSPCELSFAGG